MTVTSVSLPEVLYERAKKLSRGPSELLQEKIIEESESPVVFCYPSSGGRKSIATGTLTINFYTGEVILTNGTRETLPGNLRSYKREYLKSLSVYTDQDVKIYTDQKPGNKWTIDAYDTPGLTNLQYQILYIEATTTTNIRVLASTHPDGILRRFSAVGDVPISIMSGQKAVTAIGTAEQLQSTSWTIKSVTVKAKNANTGFIYVGDSTVSSTTGFHLGADAAISLDISDISTVWIDTSVNGEGVSWIAVY